MGWLVGMILSAVIAAAGVANIVQKGATPNSIAPTVMLLLLTGFFLYKFVNWIKLNYGKKMTVEHMAGLPVPEGAYCNVYLCPDKYIFERNEKQYTLPFSKVQDVAIKTETEIDKIHNYLIFSYDKDGQTDFISFDVTNALKITRKFVSAFFCLPKEGQKIGL